MSFDDLLQRRPARQVERPDAETARVVLSDKTGVYAAPIAGDLDTPIGPCRGPKKLKPGTVVLIVHTDDGSWIAAVDGAD